MRLELGDVALRSFTEHDAEALVPLANDRQVSRNMRDLFPFPYGPEHARSFLEKVNQPGFGHVFAIEVKGELAGACGVHPMHDVYAKGAEIGYWLGRRFHGRGVATTAIGALTRYGFETLGLERLEARVFAWNAASARVLEKNGFVREGTLRNSVFKDGQLIDSWLYAKLRER